jgi:hypothetical protein
MSPYLKYAFKPGFATNLQLITSDNEADEIEA